MNHEIFGWTGKVLHIDLTTREIRVEQPDMDLYREFLGGRGMAGHFLRPHCDRDWNDPAMPVLVFAGSLTGTDAPASSRCCIMSRSPLTGTVADATVGGRLGTEIKHAGWDGLILTGQADAPCGVIVEDRKVRLVEAAHLWGREVPDLFRELEARAPADASVSCIGPAAINGSPLAGITVDRRHFSGRGGLGLSLAAKNMLYLAVCGTGRVAVRNPMALASAREDILRLSAASPVLMGRHGFSNWGTAALCDLTASRRMMPTDNFSRTFFPAAASCNAPAMHARYDSRAFGCPGCHVNCKRESADGRVLPEFDALSHFTALICNDDLELAVDAVSLCRKLGLDPVSVAGTLACLREMDGADFDRETLIARIREMAEGGDLGQGALHFAETCGRPEFAMAVKGLELPAFDPRGAHGLALAYAVSTRGGCHSRAFPVSHEVLRKPVATDRFSFIGKAPMIKGAEDLYAAAESLIACNHMFLSSGMEEYARAFSAVTGMAVSGVDLLRAGERIVYNERIMNAMNGFAACDDDLPERFSLGTRHVRGRNRSAAH
ncbi:aldehyde ferredoxin oxidoreductase family protein [Pseudodesulfovibrio tunisiensis]|uniref:aldehyde ferredoxin oxidoreductase family protein n=1 Tax=Pseudodesulfovibrio tunisiensis TaxID=463192 RepID=UPI0024372BE8|nr:aldehyde ferredoxin oxidoreductase C-terminal domain-containing protein [Pseudodesulfovibrio tunisiensis]